MRPVNAIAVMNRSAVDNATIALFIEAYRAELPAFAEEWMIPVPGLNLYPANYEEKPEEEAVLFFVDSAGNPNTFGAHSALGLSRWTYIDVASCKAGGEPIDRCFGHELFEMAVDPDISRWTVPINGVRYAIEVSDSVQRFSRARRAEFMGRSGDVQIADRVTPRFFDPSASSGPFDNMGILARPFEIGAGGYLMQASDAAVTVAGDTRVRVTNFGRTFRRMVKGAPTV